MSGFERLVQAAQAEGTLRADVGAGDVAIMFSLALREPPAPTSPAVPEFDRTTTLAHGSSANRSRPLARPTDHRRGPVAAAVRHLKRHR